MAERLENGNRPAKGAMDGRNPGGPGRLDGRMLRPPEEKPMRSPVLPPSARLGAFTALAALTLAALPPAERTAQAAEFDGRWSVVVVTDKGTCDRAYRYEVKVERGRVDYVGDAAIDFAGKVSPAGAVHVDLGKGQATARATGKLGRDVGAGTWTGASGNGACSGRWEAERR